jgi:K+-sensing histidine kinase KdpD
MTAVRWLLAPILGDQLPFTTLIIAVLVAARYGGLGPAVLATAISDLVALFLFLPPIYSLNLGGSMGGVRILLFSLTGLIAGLLGESPFRAQIGAEAAAAKATELHRRYRESSRTAR